VAGNGQKELKTVNTRICFIRNHGNKMRMGARGGPCAGVRDYRKEHIIMCSGIYPSRDVS
jgi:hypothetical protein